MRTPNCPNCLKSPEISFKSRIVLPTKNGIPCKKCQTLLIPPIWEGLTLLFPFAFPHLIFGFSPHPLSGENWGLFSLSFFILAAISVYLTATFMPLQIKSELKENKWLFVLFVFISIPAIYLISILIHSN